MRLKRRVFYFVGILLCVVLALFLIVKSATIVSSGGSLSSPETSEMTSVSGEQSQPITVPTESLEDPPETTQSLQIEEIAVPEHKPVYNYTEEELDLLARLIYSEGGIESYETQLKIGSVVMNRVDDPYFPNTIREVIYQRNQFSVTFTRINGVIMIDRPADEEAKKAAYEILNYGSVLPKDVQVFYEKSITTGWVASREPYGTYDHTTFAYIYPKGEK
ncbi:MAG: cell wall hydrolase [Ruminococcus sp.]|nr:cell wall hydrolase [Ruminococcus sp.]